MTRRSFLLAASSAAASFASKPLNIGVGTFSYHSRSIDEMIVRLQKERIREIEMSRGEFMLMKPPTAQM